MEKLFDFVFRVAQHKLSAKANEQLTAQGFPQYRWRAERSRMEANMSMRCPKCRATSTRAYAVQFRQETTMLSYQCYQCGNAWQTTENSSPRPVTVRNRTDRYYIDPSPRVRRSGTEQ